MSITAAFSGRRSNRVRKNSKSTTTAMNDRIGDFRLKHHTLAILVAHGLDAAQIERAIGVDRSRVDLMPFDPSFKELVDYYRDGGKFNEGR
jgi:hypothetical protein